MLTQKKIQQARISNQNIFKNPEKYTIRRLVGRLNLAYLKALEQAIDTIVLNKNMFKQDDFCIEVKELNRLVCIDTIALQELAHERIMGIGYRTLIEEFDLQEISQFSLVDKAIVNYNKRSSLYTEVVHADNSNTIIGLNITLPKRK